MNTTFGTIILSCTVRLHYGHKSKIRRHQLYVQKILISICSSLNLMGNFFIVIGGIYHSIFNNTME